MIRIHVRRCLWKCSRCRRHSRSMTWWYSKESPVSDVSRLDRDSSMICTVLFHFDVTGRKTFEATRRERERERCVHLLRSLAIDELPEENHCWSMNFDRISFVNGGCCSSDRWSTNRSIPVCHCDDVPYHRWHVEAIVERRPWEKIEIPRQ